MLTAIALGAEKFLSMPLNVPPAVGRRAPLLLLACSKYASTCRWTIVRQPLCAAVGNTHAESVIPVVRLSEAELLTRTRLLEPLKLSALP